MPAQPPIVIDQYSPLDHKDLVASAAVASRYTPTWVPAADRRRLAAYLAYSAYMANSARVLLDSVDADDRRVHREYGDPARLVDQVVDAVLGEGWQVLVTGAAGDLLAGPDLPPAPEAPADPDDVLARRIYEIRQAAWERTVGETVDAWEAQVAAQPAAQAIQVALDRWITKAQLASHLDESEHDAVGLGDGILVQWPGGEGEWPSVQVLDPDSYFPDLDDAAMIDGFPRRVCFAWEQIERVDGIDTTVVRRLTFALVPVTSVHVVEGDDGAPAWDGGESPLLSDDETYDDGDIVRHLPWHSDDDEPATHTCWFSDGTWAKSRIEAGDPHALNDSEALYWTEPGRDLGGDFLPVVHVPNTPAGKTHYGTSVLARVAQVADDVAQIDTDIMAASGYIGAPTIAMSGVAPGSDAVVAPGQAYGLGESGRMDVLDLSAGLDKLVTLVSAGLQDRFWQNAGVPREVVGRAAADSASGIHLALKLAPYAQLIAGLRLPRGPKYELFIRQTLRMAMLSGAIDPQPLPEVRFSFGNFLPISRDDTVTMVATALAAHAISTRTAVALLIAAGVPVGDADGEVERIGLENETRYKAAKDLADATGSEQLAAEHVGLVLPETAQLTLNLS